MKRRKERFTTVNRENVLIDVKKEVGRELASAWGDH